MTDNKKIIFELPDNTSLVDIIYAILDSNGFSININDPKTFPKKNGESKALIIRDATIIIFKKTITEEQLAIFLEKHLDTNLDIAKKIIADVKEKLVPYAREISADEEKRETVPKLSTQEVILQKIRQNAPAQETPVAPPPPVETVKPIEIKDVEENAEKIHEVGKRGQDTYREPI